MWVELFKVMNMKIIFFDGFDNVSLDFMLFRLYLCYVYCFGMDFLGNVNMVVEFSLFDVLEVLVGV